MARGSLHAPPPAHVKAHFNIDHLQLANGYPTPASSSSTFAGSTTSHHHSHSSGSSSSSSNFLLPTLIPALKLSASSNLSSDESTRVQLQRQRLRDRALLGKAIPGFKTSAAFFASLRSNLRLNASPPPLSPISTPNSMRASTGSLPPPSPLNAPADSVMGDTDETSLSSQQQPTELDPLAGVPELSSYLVKTDEEKIDALKLVADSVAQQRQAANSSLIYHPLNASIMVGLLSVAVRTMIVLGYDYTAYGLTCLGLIMSFFAICRYSTQGYLFAAEAINFEWLGDADVLVTKFGDEVIGTCVIEWVSGESRRSSGKKKAWRGLIKAWAVKMRYRGKGVGSALLEDAVKEAKRKGAEGLEFAEDHANSKRFLPSMYNDKFDRRERRSRELLLELYESSSPVHGRGKKK